MDAPTAIDMMRQAIILMAVLAGPVLGVCLAVGLIVSILQAVTLVQDQTLSFVPKILATLLALVVFGPWMITRLVEFGREMFGPMP